MLQQSASCNQPLAQKPELLTKRFYGMQTWAAALTALIFLLTVVVGSAWGTRRYSSPLQPSGAHGAGLNVSLGENNSRVPAGDISCGSVETCRDRERPGCYRVRFKIDRNYKKIVVKWYQLKGYSETTGKHQGRKLVYETTSKDLRRNPSPSFYFSVDVDVQNFSHGIYQVGLKAESTTSFSNNSCDMVYRYDGDFHRLRKPVIVLRSPSLSSNELVSGI